MSAADQIKAQIDNLKAALREKEEEAAAALQEKVQAVARMTVAEQQANVLQHSGPGGGGFGGQGDGYGGGGGGGRRGVGRSKTSGVKLSKDAVASLPSEQRALYESMSEDEQVRCRPPLIFTLAFTPSAPRCRVSHGPARS